VIDRIGSKYKWSARGIALTVSVVMTTACSTDKSQPGTDATVTSSPVFEPILDAPEPAPNVGTPIGNGSDRPIFSDVGGEPEIPLPLPSEPTASDTPPNTMADVLADLPKLAAVETMASGLRIGWTESADAELVDTQFVEDRWIALQACLGVSAASPLVVMTDGSPSPLRPDDDVLRYIDGSITATSSQYDEGAVIQVNIADLDKNDSLGNYGSNLQQILSRYVWFANGLNERDYPYQCARDEGV